MPSTCYQALGSSTWYKYLATKYLVPRIGKLVIDTMSKHWYHTACLKYLLPTAWYQVLGTKYLVASTWHTLLSTWYWPRNTWYLELGTKCMISYEFQTDPQPFHDYPLGGTPKYRKKGKSRCSPYARTLDSTFLVHDSPIDNTRLVSSACTCW